MIRREGLCLETSHTTSHRFQPWIERQTFESYARKRLSVFKRDSRYLFCLLRNSTWGHPGVYGGKNCSISPMWAMTHMTSACHESAFSLDEIYPIPHSFSTTRWLSFLPQILYDPLFFVFSSRTWFALITLITFECNQFSEFVVARLAPAWWRKCDWAVLQ